MKKDNNQALGDREANMTKKRGPINQGKAMIKFFEELEPQFDKLTSDLMIASQNGIGENRNMWREGEPNLMRESRARWNISKLLEECPGEKAASRALIEFVNRHGDDFYGYVPRNYTFTINMAARSHMCQGHWDQEELDMESFHLRKALETRDILRQAGPLAELTAEALLASWDKTIDELVETACDIAAKAA